MTKPYKGEIYDWTIQKTDMGDCIRGTQYKAKSSPMKSDEVCLIHTSQINSMQLRGPITILNTLNSVYVLVGPETIA